MVNWTLFLFACHVDITAVSLHGPIYLG